MKRLASLRFRIAALFRRSELDTDLDEELRSHVQHRADDLERTGVPRAKAERRARVEFGAYQRIREESREAAGGTFLESLWQDGRYAFRVLRKSPGFTVVAIVTLALGIGANTVVFGVLNALVLRPLDLPHAESLYGIDQDDNGYGSYPDYLDLRDQNRSFEGLAAYNISEAALDTGSDPERAWLYEVSGNYFDALGITPEIGRVLHSTDEHGPNSAPYLVLGYAYWESRFQADRSVVGRTVLVNRHPFVIVGVAPPAFRGTLLVFNPDFYVPLVNHEQVDGENELEARSHRWVFEVLGHLKAGVTPTQATADLASISTYLERTYPKEDGRISFSLARPSLFGNFLGRPVRAFMAGLMLLAGLILLAACANLGSLFAARTADRSREVALRLALGASRLRIVRQLFTEAVLIALVGGTVGLAGSVALLRALSTWQPFSRYPIRIPTVSDAQVYLVALVLAVASGLLFGAVPLRQVLRTDPYEVVKSGSIRRIGRRLTIRDISLVVQIAICAVLVTSSLVALRGLVRSQHSSVGFEPSSVLLVDPDPQMAGYTNETISDLRRRMIEALLGIPGVNSVGITDIAPLTMDSMLTTVFNDDATDLTPANAAAHPYLFNVSPDYLHAAGTVLLAGRDLTWHDDERSPRVAIVNQEFARKVMGGTANVLGRYFKRRDGTRIQVVGVVEDGKYFTLAEDQRPALFLPLLQSPSAKTWLVVRSVRDPLEAAEPVRSTLKGIDAGLPVYVETWTQAMDAALFPSRIATMALGVLGLMGAMLSVTGIFGMAAYSVSKRLRELGIRIALGAQHTEVLQAALGRAIKLLAAGSAVGLVLGILASRVLAFIVYEASPRDPFVLAGVVFAMLLLGVLATWIPALRALSVDPLRLLREE